MTGSEAADGGGRAGGRKPARDWAALEREHGLEVYPKRDITLVRGRGAEVWDDRGRRYIDCVAGIGVASVGHANPEVAAAVAEQARTLVACPGIFYNDARARLAAKLASIAPPGLSRTFFCNSGAEAVEAAIKFARLTTGRAGVVATTQGFHGRTLGALSATHKPLYRDAFGPLVPGFEFVPFNNAERIAEAVDDEVAAVLIEQVQGEGGVRPAERDFLAAAREACDRTGALLVFDEIQTGFCRTGTMFACERHGIYPDILCLAKAIAGGVPMGAVMAGPRIEVAPGKHGSTYGGNPLACAAALAAIRFMEREGLARRAEELGARLRRKVESASLAQVRAVRQAGLMVGVEVRGPCAPRIAALAGRGVLTLPAGPSVIRILPPLVATRAQIDEVADALAAVLA